MKRDRLEANRILSWADIVIPPEGETCGENDIPNCVSPFECLKRCTQTTRILKAKAVGANMEDEYEAAAKMCALMLKAVERANMMHLIWKRVCWGREKNKAVVKELTNYLDTVANHGRHNGWYMKGVSSIVHDLKSGRKREDEEEESDEDE